MPLRGRRKGRGENVCGWWFITKWFFSLSFAHSQFSTSEPEQPHISISIMSWWGGNLLEKFRISSKKNKTTKRRRNVDYKKWEYVCALQYSYHFSLTSQDNFPTLILTFRHLSLFLSFFFPTSCGKNCEGKFFSSSSSFHLSSLVHNWIEDESFAINSILFLSSLFSAALCFDWHASHENEVSPFSCFHKLCKRRRRRVSERKNRIFTIINVARKHFNIRTFSHAFLPLYLSLV